MNILLTGQAGCGKSEMVRFVAQELQLAAWRIRFDKVQADRVNVPESNALASQTAGFSVDKPSHRLSPLLQACQRLSQQVVPEPRTLWVMEGIDRIDALQFYESDKKNTLETMAWLEWMQTLSVPVIWVCQKNAMLDDSFLREFDLVLEVKRSQSRMLYMILELVFGYEVDKEWVDWLVRSNAVTPADLRHVGKMIKHLDTNNLVSFDSPQELIEHQLRRRLAIRGESLETPVLEVKNPEFDLTLLNADVDISGLCNRLVSEEVTRASICLMGPPGSGKTGLAWHVARLLNCHVVYRSAATLFDKYIGETEKNIEKLFAEAKQKHAMIILDEADQFFVSRHEARRSWERSQVSELLIAMERFEGVFMVTTNQFEVFDAAAIRRFDLKVSFEFLKPNQCRQLFCQTLHQLGMKRQVKKVWLDQVAQMDRLTPGDFKVVARRANLLQPRPDEQWFFSELQKEVQFKPARLGKRSIGFVGAEPTQISL
jgi:energy-coupling factor transporter ATP-binding protein EcfA2